MAIYAIGDVQGCYKDLMCLLAMVEFNPAQDRLWFTGDLVNRGPQSLEVLRFVRDLGSAAVTVLGNHDLHLLALAHGVGKPHRSDTLQSIFNAPDRDDLLGWLRQQPMLHHDPDLQATLIHAGLPPQWDLSLARECAAELEAVLRGEDYEAFLHAMYGNKPDCWSNELQGTERLRFITNCLTRLRYCDADGRLQLKYKGKPGTQPAYCVPWFEVPGRRSRDMKIFFGHWSTLGLYQHQGVVALDTGCLWGGSLTAMRLEDEAVYRYDCRGYQEIIGSA